MTDHTIVSADGTKLSASVTGSGPPLVLVHGITSCKETWAFVRPHLAEEHTVWAYDRRGRGESEAGDEGYGLEAEGEDVRAVLDAAGPGADLLAHSFGAVCALEAVAGGVNIASLTLYEPPVHAQSAADAMERALERLRAGDREGALAVFLPEVAGFSPAEVAMVQSIPPVWARFVDTVPTLEREAGALMAYEWEPSRFRSVGAPTLLLAGELTDAPIYATREQLRDAFPHAEEHAFEGQRHIAYAADPEGFANTVLAFTRRH